MKTFASSMSWMKHGNFNCPLVSDREFTKEEWWIKIKIEVASMLNILYIKKIFVLNFFLILSVEFIPSSSIDKGDRAVNMLFVVRQFVALCILDRFPYCNETSCRHVRRSQQKEGVLKETRVRETNNLPPNFLNRAFS
jgi:hypothetical protein